MQIPKNPILSYPAPILAPAPVSLFYFIFEDSFLIDYDIMCSLLLILALLLLLLLNTKASILFGRFISLIMLW